MLELQLKDCTKTQRMQEQLSVNCLIIGAGPSGLTLGIGLLKLGKSVLIAEKHTESLGFSRALLINSQTLKDLSNYDALVQMKLESIPVTGVSLYSSGTLITESYFDPTFNLEFHPIVLPQDTTEKHLKNSFLSLGGRFLSGMEFCLEDQVPQNLSGSQKYILRKRNNGQRGTDTLVVQCNWLFGCDGIHSNVRNYMKIPNWGTNIPEKRYLVDVEVKRWPFDTTGVLHLEMTGGTVSILISHTPPTVRLVGASREAIHARLAQLDIEKIIWDGMFTTQYKIAKCYGRGHAWLVGDAAHSHSPVGGRGMNLGIQEAHALVGAIGKDDLSSYERKRWTIARNWVVINYFLTQLLWSSSIVFACLRIYLCIVLYLYSYFFGQSFTKWIFEQFVASARLKGTSPVHYTTKK